MIRDYTNKKADIFYKEIIENTQKLPFSFVYGEKQYNGIFDDEFEFINKEKTSNGDKETVVFEFLLKKQLTVYLNITHYFSHGFTDWVVEFENKSAENSEIIEKIGLSMVFKGENPVLKGILGDHENLYRPYEHNLVEENVYFCSDSGRATHVYFPYFNLEYGNGGVMLAIGWAGTWTANFEKIDEGVLYSAKSVNGLKTYLKPGEKIRTAMFVVGEYTKRDEAYATNYWRDWYISYVMPKADADGNSLQPFSACCLSSDTGLPQSDGSISECYFTWKPSLEKMIEEDVKVDFRWFDAGWYIAPDMTSALSFWPGRDWWDTVGTWELDPNKWPGNTFLESTDFARANGMKTLMWFEPERVTDPENLAKNFGYNADWAIRMENEKVISNNIGNPECLKWTLDRICTTLKKNKVEMYREDNNGDPSKLWNYLDSKEGNGREGITECKFIDGHYKMWDEIIECTKSYGGCAFVDSCASGGGRNDLESMRRGIPLLRSDNDRTSTALRLSMTTAFNKWIPFCGANTKEKLEQLALKGVSDVYTWRASYLPVLNVNSQFAQDPEQDFDILRFGLKEWKKINQFLLKEFYTLTPWHPEEDKSGFTAYTYFDPQTQKGVLFVFRMEDCEESSIEIKLPFTEKILITDEDTKVSIEIENGTFTDNLNEKRMAKLYFYEVR